MDEKEISTQYCNLPDDKVKLYGTYTTRPEGFIDVLLSRLVLSSEEAHRLLGHVKTHRGTSMGGREHHAARNEAISISPGHVSFKYFDSDLRNRDEFEGGVGIFVPLPKLLEHDPINFMHTSGIGDLGMYDVTKENIEEAAHRARKEGKLKDTGFGYVFEIMLYAEGEYRKWTNFPRIDLEDSEVIAALPESMKKQIYNDITERQAYYQKLFDRLQEPEIREKGWNVFDDRDIFYPDETEALLERMLEPFDEERINLLWYDDRNLEVALHRISITT